MIKRKYLLALAFVLSLSSTYAQNEMDAYKLSKNDLRGTARSVAMGGAFGALGGDISGVAINPAGIGVYTKSEIVTTIDFQNTNTETNFGGYKVNDSKFKFLFDNIGVVGAFPINSDVAPLVNFGFTYNRLKSFDRKYSTKGNGGAYSLSEYIANKATLIGAPTSDINLGYNKNAFNNQDWLSVLGYNSFLIDGRPNNQYIPFNQQSKGSHLSPETSSLFVEEKGGIYSYDFNVGTTFSDLLSIGLTISMTDIDYSYYSLFKEDFYDGVGEGGYDLENTLKTTGSGWQVKAGAILKPIEELRIGIAYHSPTWYNMTDEYYAVIDHNLSGLVGGDNMLASNYKSGAIYSYDYNDGYLHHTPYELRTPDKWVFSLAGVVGGKAILSLDWDLTDYTKMKFADDYGSSHAYSYENENIKSSFKLASTLRVGGEYRFTNQFSGRIGYSWMQSPLETRFKNNEFTIDAAGSIPHYVLDGDTNILTYGLGYRFTPNFYMDVAFAMTWLKDDLYLFPYVLETDNGQVTTHIQPDKIDLKTNKFQGLLTLGYRF